MTGTRTTPSFERRLIGLAVAACFAGAVHANPTGPTVVSGAASFASSGNTLTVTNTPGAIINWQQFSIRPDEVTRFIQSGAASAVLNRVTGGDPSAILGQLLSNGRVFLINPNGVVVGAGARIDTAGFVASSLNLSNEDFLAGRFRFTDPGNAGKVTNAGTISAHSGGAVYLVAPTVENHGVITAPNGDILLAAGKSVELVSAANPSLRVQVQAGGEAVNIGQLLAESGHVGLYGAAIRNAGTVSADSAAVNAAGNVVLKASRDVTLEATSVVSANGAQGGSVHVQAEGGTLLADGRVEATGAAGRGGAVKLLGTQVGLVGDAAVDASGASGGGTVLVGGDFQGANPQVQNARATFVGAEATITADATSAGDGGRVIVWADDTTQFYGAIAARAGAGGGNGGFVETSGHNLLDARGTVDTSAPAGATGTWLLDPTDMSITTTANANVTGATPFQPTAAGSVLTWATIDGALATSAVTVRTTAGFNAGQPGNITIVNPYTYSRTNALTFQAANNIVQNAGANIQNNAAGALNFTASGTGAVAFNANVTTANGAVTVTAPGGLTQAAGTTINTGNAALTVNVGAASAMNGVIAGAGASLVKQGAGTLTLSGANTYGGNTTATAGTLAAGSNSAFGTGTLVLNGGTVAAAGGARTLGNAVSLAVNSTLGGTNNLTFTNTLTNTAAGNRTLTVSNTGTTTLGAVNLSNSATNRTVTINNTGAVNVTGVIANGGTSAASALTKTGAGTLTLSGANTYGGATTVSAGTLVAASSTALGTAAGATTVAAGAELDISGAGLTIAEPLTLNGTGVAGGGALRNLANNNTVTGAITLGAGGARINTDAGTLTISGAGNITGAGQPLTVGGAGNTTISKVIATGAGTLTKDGAGTLTLSGANTYTGATTVNAGTLVASNAAALGATAGDTTVAGGATLNINNVAIGAENVTINGNGVGGAGALTGTGAASLGGAVTVASASRIGATAGNSLTLGGTINGANALDVAGGGTLTFGGAVGGVTPLASLTSAAGTTLNVNGGLVRTTGAQTYDGPVTSGGPTTLQTANANLVANGAVTATAGTLTLDTGTGGVTMTNAANDFATVAIPAAGTVSLVDQSALALGAASLASLQARTLAGDLTLNGAVSATGGGNAVVLASGANFVNNAGPAALDPGAGRWVVYSTDPAANTFGGLASGNQALWNATFAGSPPGTIPAGNRYVFTTQPTITFTSTDVAKTYGQDATATVAGAYVTSGFVNAALYGSVFTQDTVANAVFGTPSVTSLGSPPTASVAGSPYAINLNTAGVTSPTGYAIAGSSAGLLSVAPAALSVTANDQAKTYGQTIAFTGTEFSSVGLQNGETIGSVTLASAGAAPTASVAGSPYAITASNATGGTFSPGNYTITYNNGVLTVAPAGLTVTADNQAKTYGQTFVFNGTEFSSVGLQNGETIGSVTLASAGAAPTASVAGSPYAITASNATGGTFSPGNYTITYNDGVLTVGPAALTVTANNQTKPYGNTFVFTGTEFTSAGLQNGETIGSVTLASAGAPPTATVLGGPYAITASNATGGTFTPGNYTITYANGVMTVTPLPITVTANNQTKVYGQPDPALTFTAPTVNGDVLAGTPVRAPGETVAGGPYAITQGTVTNANNPNYTITFVNGQLVITPAALTIAADNQARLYGDPNPPLTATFTGLTNGDTPAAIPGVTLTTPATIASNAGSYAINVASGANANYTITYVNGQLVIAPAPLTITADDAARRFGEPNPAFTAAASGFKLGQTLANLNGALALDTPATVLSPVGTYPIVPSGVSSPNYTITFVDGRLIVGQGIPPADPALVTATQRSADGEEEFATRAPGVKGIDCLALERGGARRVLNRCF